MRRGNLVMGGALAAAMLTFAGGAAQANTVINLGQSAQDFTLYGQGATAQDGFGTFTIGQGAGTTNGVTSTFTLSGDIVGGGSPGFTTGTYSLVTTYAGTDTPTAGPNAPVGFTNPSATNQFFYGFLAPSVSMTLFLDTPHGTDTIPLVTDGNFDGPGFGFGFVTAQCSGISSCTQFNVGLTPGSSIFGPVDTTVTVFGTAVPEPATWAMMLVGFGGLGVALRSRRRTAVAA